MVIAVVALVRDNKREEKEGVGGGPVGRAKKEWVMGSGEEAVMVSQGVVMTAARS